MKQILWDWNGTLLDDVWYCMRVRNRTFPPLGVRGVESLEQYHREFTFPIFQYYANAGVKPEQFDTVAHAWMHEYEIHFDELNLFEDAVSTLEAFRKAGIRQVILSATKLDMLKYQVGCFPIESYFSELLGLTDIYGKSKVQIGIDYLKACGVAPKDTWMIGDTLHDAEVAEAMGTRCLLVCRGHHSRQRLEAAGVPIADTLTQAAQIILNAE